MAYCVRLAAFLSDGVSCLKLPALFTTEQQLNVDEEGLTAAHVYALHPNPVFLRILLLHSTNICSITQGPALQTVMVYANSKNTEIRAKLKLRSTTQGANNRLDIESIVSFDKADGISTPVMGTPLLQ